VASYRALGFTDFIFPMPPAELVPVMEQCARSAIPELRRQG
jgi:hypothetical protein